MDNRKGEARKIDAKALTAEIEQATNHQREQMEHIGRMAWQQADIRGGKIGVHEEQIGQMKQARRSANVQSGEDLRDAGVLREPVRQIGNGALTEATRHWGPMAVVSGEEPREMTVGNAELIGVESVNHMERVNRAETEIKRDEIELEHPEEVVGDESRLQVAEHLADDREDLEHELGQGLKFEVKATTKGQEEVTRKVVPEVDKIINKSSFRVRELEDVYRQGVNATLGVFNRRIGDRNGVGGNAA